MSDSQTGSAGVGDLGGRASQEVDPAVLSGSSSSSSSWFLRLQNAILTDLSEADELSGAASEGAGGEHADPDNVDAAVLDEPRLREQEPPGAEAVHNCDPCLFHFSERGCRKGSDCGYCHLDHVHAHRPAQRPRKQTRDRYKRNIIQLVQGHENLDEIHDELQEAARKNPYMRNFIQGFLENSGSVAIEAVEGLSTFAPAPRIPGPQPKAASGGRGGASSSGDPLPDPTSAGEEDARQPVALERFSL
ncbi:unnamed protein product [Symbiodinium sp. CCMP2592]|nr:unnamed protein product [Symbiodinium sp. CCMP2592]